MLELSHSAMGHVLVHIECSAATALTIWKASTKMLYNDKYHWLLIEDYSLHVSAGVFFLAEHPRLDLTDEDKDEDKDRDKDKYKVRAKDAIADELEPIEGLMETLNFYMNTELTLAKRQNQDDSFALYDVWYVAPFLLLLLFLLISIWKRQTQLSVVLATCLLFAGDSEC